MLIPGLISVTFRKLSSEQIIQLAVRAGLQAIEWGGDIHVPHGDLQHAEAVGSWTRAAGIEVASYGSYYRAGCGNTGQTGGAAFDRVLATAEALQAPSIRVWAGDRASASADELWWARMIEDTRRISDLAGEAGMTIDLEFHGGTLTDTADTALRLLADVNRPNLRCHWQPQVHAPIERRLRDLQQLLPWLANLHVYHWLQEERCPLIDGQEEWEQYIAEASKTGRSHYALLEFVKDDDPEQFLSDAATLLYLIRKR